MADTVPTENSTGWTNSSPNEIARECLAAASQGTRLVDIGAAFGVATIPALRAGASVVANDLSGDHLDRLAANVPPELASELRLAEGRFPTEWRMAADSVDAVLASNVLHFLRGDELLHGLQSIHDWLRPGGSLHVLVNSPYLAYLERVAPVFEAKLRAGDSWPGEIANVREICDTRYVSQLPSFLHVFTDATLSAIVKGAGFEIEHCEMFRRRDIPSFGILDGRENVWLRARKVHPDHSRVGEEFSSPLLTLDTSAIESIRRLRKEAWAAEGVAIAGGPILVDAHDEHARHWVIEDRNAAVVAAARLCFHDSVLQCPDATDFHSLAEAPGPVASLNRLVVAPTVRRRGLSLLLDEARIAYARRKGCASVVVSADSTRARSLVQRGFTIRAQLAERAAVARGGAALSMDLRRVVADA